MKNSNFWFPSSRILGYADKIEKAGDTYLIGNLTDSAETDFMPAEPRCRLFSISQRTEITSFPCSRSFSVNLSKDLAFILDEGSTRIVSLRDNKFSVISVFPQETSDVAANDRVFVFVSSSGICQIFSSDEKYLKTILPEDLNCSYFICGYVTENNILLLTEESSQILVFSLDGEYQYDFYQDKIQSMKTSKEHLYCSFPSWTFKTYTLGRIPAQKWKFEFPLIGQPDNDFCIDENGNVHCLGSKWTVST